MSSPPDPALAEALAEGRRTARLLTYDALGAVTATHRAAPPDRKDAAELRRIPLTGWERSVFSQWGEDGVIAQLLRRVGVSQRFFVEFGVETGRECNTALLARALGWSGLMMEADPRLAAVLHERYSGVDRVRTVEAVASAGNIEQLFAEHGVPTEPDVLSIDVDGADWWIWRAIRHHRPRIVVVEYNGQITPDRAITVPADHAAPWDGTLYYGASALAWERLGRAKGYRLVHTELNGVNAFLVRDDLCDAMPDRDVVPVHMAGYDLRDIRHPADPHGRPWVTIGDDGHPVP